MTSPTNDQQTPAWADGGRRPGRRAEVAPDTAGLPMAEEPETEPGDDDLFEREWDRPRRSNRLTAVLAAGLVAVAGFTGGVLAQKQHDAGLASSAASNGSAARNRAAAGGFSGFGTAGGAPGGFAGASGPGAAGAESAAGAGGAAAQVPVVVGTVASITGTTLKVKNFADAVVTVQVPATATVTTPGLTGLKVGMSVSVVGAKAADGTVTATAVTGRVPTG
jgi:hypothetical protein